MACRDLEREMRWLLAIGYEAEGPAFTDPRQGITGQFMVLGGSRVELLEALPGEKVLEPWLAQGSPLYHLGFEVPDLEAAMETLVATRAKLVSEPKPAVAFGGRPVAFFFRPNRMLVELIQAAPEAS